MANNSGSSGIDAVYDLVDRFVENADRVFNRTKQTEDKHRARQARTVDTAPGVKTQPSTTKALARRRFRIVEAIDATSGQPTFVVTDGADARVECGTRELAEKILVALEAA